MNLDGSDFHPTTPAYESYSLAGWSPDGQSLLLKNTTDYGVTYRLCIYNLQTGEYRYMTDHYYDQATWSPDGSLIAYVGWKEQNFDLDIVVIHPDGSGETDLTYTLDREDTQPVWSPDSRWLAFTSRRADIANDPNDDIYVIRLDGSGEKQITTNLQSDRDPFWQP